MKYWVFNLEQLERALTAYQISMSEAGESSLDIELAIDAIREFLLEWMISPQGSFWWFNQSQLEDVITSVSDYFTERQISDVCVFLDSPESISHKLYQGDN